VAGSVPGRGVLASGTASEEGVGEGEVGAPVRAGTCTWMTIESSVESALPAARGTHRTDATSTAAVTFREFTTPSLTGEGENGATGG